MLALDSVVIRRTVSPIPCARTWVNVFV